MRRIDLSPLIAAVGGLILVVSLFLGWYQPGLSAWTVFEVLDLVLAALGLAALGWVAASLFWDVELPDRALPLLGGAAFVVVVSQLLNHPPAAQGAGVEGGAWLGLAGSLLMVVGGILSGTRISLAVSVSAPAPTAGPATEAAAVEPEVQDELYPEQQRSGPIGADDPEPWTASPDDETMSFEPESEERS